MLDVIRAAEDVAGRAVPYDVVDRRPGDPVTTFADPSLAHELLGWSAESALYEIVRTASDWHARRV